MTIAHQLRAGNIHHVDNGINVPRLGIISDTVEGENYSMITTYGIHLVDKGDKDFIPVVLTEAWLEKLGFSILRVAGVFHQATIKPLNQPIFRVTVNKGKICFYYDNTRRVVLDYVHQLQNLFFCLTTEELKLT